jgi:ribose transport system ATP-binding protein
MAEYALQMQDITKTYGGVTVLDNVDLSVKKGEIHALLGENGAGKTTLMNILGGVTPRDKGEIKLFGAKAKINKPADSQDMGVAFIHQELNVVNDLLVYENMFLGRELRNKAGILDAKKMCAESTKIFDKMNVHIDPRRSMHLLETSYKQIVEIAKALLMDARLIIMDEPTTSLTQSEIDNAFEIIRGLTANHDVTVIFISHKLGEVVDFCNSYTVLRNGLKVAEGAIEENGEKISQTDIAKVMVGRENFIEKIYESRELGEKIFEVKNLSVPNHVNDISFSLRRGEILGLTGLLGDGKYELVRALFGDIKHEGDVIKQGKKLKLTHPAGAKRSGIGYLPPNRKENAIIKDMSVRDNMTIVALEKCLRHGIINRKMETQVANDYKGRLGIKMDRLTNPITSLSGGNQQKVVLSKWVHARPDIIVMANPTQGVDVGAKNEIYEEIIKLAKQGVGIIIASGEAQEIIKLCDRALVLYHGDLRGELDRSKMTEENIMILSTGGTLN